MKCLSLQILTAGLLASCASTAPVNHQYSPIGEVEPEGPPQLEFPWLLIESDADLGPLSPDIKLPEVTPTPIFGVSVSELSKNVPSELLPKPLQKALGKKLWAFSEMGEKLCEVVITGYAARVVFEPESSEATEIFDPYIEDSNEDGMPDAPASSEHERYTKAFDDSPKRLVAVLTRDGLTPYEGCGELGELDLFVSDRPLTRLPTLTEVSPELSHMALAAFRSHAFWDLQQDAYQRSVEDERTRVRMEVEEAKKQRWSREEIAELRDGDRSKDAPKTWDEGKEEWNGPSFRAWGEEGKPIFIEVELGHDLSCAAPRAWMIFRVDGSTLETAAFDVGRPPSMLVDVGDDGRYEMLRGGWLDKRIESLDLEGAQLRGLSFTSPNEHHCEYSSLGPVSVP